MPVLSIDILCVIGQLYVYGESDKTTLRADWRSTSKREIRGREQKSGHSTISRRIHKQEHIAKTRGMRSVLSMSGNEGRADDHARIRCETNVLQSTRHKSRGPNLKVEILVKNRMCKFLFFFEVGSVDLMTAWDARDDKC